jgi:histidinol phosphatase-like enzyme (inositol monophosphatase family)
VAATDDIEARLELAVAIAREAGQITLAHFRRGDLVVERKGDDSPVTIADRRAEEHLRQRIAGGFADDGVLGEELPERPGTSGYRWILDPIDGTKSFIHGVPLYSTLVAVERDGEPLLGVIRIPALDETVYAAVGRGAWYLAAGRPPVPAVVSETGSLAESLFLTSEVASFDEIGRRAAYDRLQAAARLSRTWGDAYGYLMVATGRAEVMVDPIVSVWDVAAVQPVIEEAGGRFTDWHARRTIHSGQAAASNGPVHEEVLAILQG